MRDFSEGRLGARQSSACATLTWPMVTHKAGARASKIARKNGSLMNDPVSARQRARSPTRKLSSVLNGAQRSACFQRAKIIIMVYSCAPKLRSASKSAATSMQSPPLTCWLAGLPARARPAGQTSAGAQTNHLLSAHLQRQPQANREPTASQPQANRKQRGHQASWPKESIFTCAKNASTIGAR